MLIKILVLMAFVVKSNSIGLDDANCVTYLDKIVGKICNSDTHVTVGASASSISACAPYCNGAVPSNQYLIACNVNKPAPSTTGACSVVYGSTRKDCTSFSDGPYREYTNCAAPPPTPNPTVSPTLSPTPSPTFECTQSAGHCASNEFCDNAMTCQPQETCSTHGDCHDVPLLPNRIPMCVDGKCVDKLSGPSCTSSDDCTLKVNTLAVDQLAYGSATKTFLSVDRISGAISIVEQTKENLGSVENLYVKFSGTDVMYVSSELFVKFNNDSLLLDTIRAKFGHENGDIVLDTGSRLLSEVNRELATTYIVTLTYVLDETTFVELNGTTFSDPNFAEALAAELDGIDPEDVAISATDGALVITLAVVDDTEYSGNTPEGTGVLETLQDIQSQFDNVTEIVAGLYNWDENDVESQSLNLCGNRDCGGFGVNLCNTQTGVCDCTGTGYWGVNCASSCSCDNGGVCREQYCECEYPYYGETCNKTSTCVENC